MPDLSRSNVDKWDFGPIRAWIHQAVESRKDLTGNADVARMYFTDVSRDWKGAAYDAAYERVAEDHDQVRKLGYEVDELVTVATQGADGVESARRVLLNKVGDAEQLGMKVNDSWQVEESKTVAADVRKAHQELINHSLWPLQDAVSKASQAVSGQAVEIRSAGDLLGSSLDVVDADTQAAWFGRDDGKALAEAVRNKDQAAIDRIVSQLPQPILSQFDADALAQGKEISTLAAGASDFYKGFFQEAGKDGILGLNDHLLAKEKAGDTVAATQRDNLANTVMALSNEKVSTTTGAKGAYTNLPGDVRELVSGRYQEKDDLAIDGSMPIRQRMLDQARFAGLLGEANPGFQPGQTFGIELARQGASLSEFVEEGNDKHHGYPPGFKEGDLATVEEAGRQFLDAGARNHQSSYALLTGKDPLTGHAIPGDLSFGATDARFNPGAFDPKKFSATVFQHEWKDDGATSAKLYEWVADGTKQPGAEGVLSRRMLTELPNVFAPLGEAPDGSVSHRPGLATQDDKVVFESNAKAFNTNPKLADGLAHVMGNNLDTFSDPMIPKTTVHDDPKVPGDHDGYAVIQKVDADRLLFLASQSEGGRLGLEVSRQAYENQMIDRAITNGGGDPQKWLSINAPDLASLDARITNAGTNALTYQDERSIGEHNDAKQETYETRQKAGDIIKSLTLDNLEIPGKSPAGAVGNQVFGVIKDEGYDALMKKINPEPNPEYAVYPDPIKSTAQANEQVNQKVIETLFTHGQLPAQVTVPGENGQPPSTVDFIGVDGKPVDVGNLMGTEDKVVLNKMLSEKNLLDFVRDYAGTHSVYAIGDLAQQQGDLHYYLTGRPEVQK